jgi:uncharacterized Ntn-hydrolase superfamily protein
MTWSILARDPSGLLGVAIASRFFAVGALCVHTRAEVGAVATQALVNPHYGAQGLDLLQAGHDAATVVRRLTEADAGQAQRQLHVMPWRGTPAAHTGSACVPWCGHRVHEGLSLAGNMLVGEAVLQASAQAYADTAGQPLAQRLIAALCAGDAAGGDKRGRQSAALRIQGVEGYPLLDIRVDDHSDPFTELQRLHGVSLERFQPFATCLPSRAQPAGELDRTRIEAAIEHFQQQNRQTARSPQP